MLNAMPSASPTRRHLLNTLLGSAGGLALAGGAMLAQAYAPAQINVHTTGLPGLTSPLRVALLADLHYGPLIGLGQVRGWVGKALSVRADLVLLLGDLMDVNLSRGMPQALLNELGRLRAPLGVWGVWGNHDYLSFGAADARLTAAQRQLRAQLAAELAQRGIHILREEGTLLRPDVYLGGVDDLWYGQPDAARALRDAPLGAARLLMSHNPDYLAHAPPNVELMLSGHTHGGQVRFPFVGALVVPSHYGQRFALGWVQSGVHPNPDEQHAAHLPPSVRGFVSRGLGVSGVPLRNLCPSEVVVLDLQPG